MLRLNYIGDFEVNSLLSCFLLAVFESILLIVCSLIFPHQHTAQSAALVWRTPWEALRGPSGGWLTNYRVWVAALLVAMVGLYVYWAGDRQFYAVTGYVTLADGSAAVGAEVTFKNDDPALNFTRVTDANGKYEFGTTAKAGGAPAGTHYRIRVVPKMDLIVRMKDEPIAEDATTASGRRRTLRVVDKVLYAVPKGTPIRKETLTEMKSLDGGWKVQATKDVLTFTQTTLVNGGEVENRVQLDRDKDVLVLGASEIPSKYGSLGTTKLTCTVQRVPMFSREKTRYNFQLK